MIHLVNGRGQLGTVLTQLEYDEDVWIYHTWNIDDKSKETQFKEYCKFRDFLVQHKEKRIIFVSTKSTKNNWYNYYKQQAESYALHFEYNVQIIRLPTLVGKGVCMDFKLGLKNPYGTMELLTLEEAKQQIESALPFPECRIVNVEGVKIPANLVFELVTL